MKLYILITAILFSGCAVHHQHGHKHHQHGHKTDIMIKEKFVSANLRWQHNVAIIVIHHKFSLSRKEKNILKHRYANHSGLGKKRVKFRFIRG